MNQYARCIKELFLKKGGFREAAHKPNLFSFISIYQLSYFIGRNSTNRNKKKRKKSCIYISKKNVHTRTLESFLNRSVKVFFTDFVSSFCRNMKFASYVDDVWTVFHGTKSKTKIWTTNQPQQTIVQHIGPAAVIAAESNLDGI